MFINLHLAQQQMWALQTEVLVHMAWADMYTDVGRHEAASGK